MAAPSPVTIESSPTYDAYQAPSITPESFRRSLSAASITRSSPQLLSPSAFVRPRPQPLKSGSRVQQVPVGANAGFASAASLWKVQKDDGSHGSGQGNETEDGTTSAGRREGGEGRKETKSTGKLTRPQKARKTREPSVASSKASESPRFDSFIDAKEDTAAPPATKVGQVNAKSAEVLRETSASRRASINLSEYSFDAEAVPAQAHAPAKVTPAVKKTVRKRPSKASVTGEAPPKKARKSKAKSEAIILDSDEPDVVLAEVGELGKEPTASTSKTVAKRPRSKAVKVSVGDKTKADGTSAKTSKTTKKETDSEKPAKESSEQSTYFAHPPTIDTEPLPSSPPPALVRAATDPTPHVNVPAEHAGPTDLVEDTSLPPTESAPRRRRSWTPVQNSLAPPENETNTLPVVSYELDENMGQVPFSEMLGNFSYLPDKTEMAKRVVSGDVGTKRRRIEVSDTTILPQQLQTGPQDVPKAKVPSKAVKSAKKPKAAPKKPQTITSLAMAPYQPPKEPDGAQSTVSAFFTPRTEVENGPVVEENVDGEQRPAKVKKPRKSRAKVQPEDGAGAPSKKPSKARTKTTKVKVKFNEKDYQPPLYSPTKAMKQMKSQDFLFGTSSQLAAEETPEFIREIQLAVRQSEMVCAMPRSSQIGTQFEQDQMDDERSRAKVPTAPHGTSLSLGQANRDLWCDGSRDASGSKLAQEVRDMVENDHPKTVTEDFAHPHQVIALSSSMGEDQGKRTTAPQKPVDQAQVPTAFEGLQASKDGDGEAALPTLPDALEHDRKTPEAANIAPHENGWVTLQSDDSVQHTEVEAPQRPMPATSPVRRTALQSLDANIALSVQDIGGKPPTLGHARSFSTTESLSGRDRTRKQALVVELDQATHSTTSPKRGRGRPRKDASPTEPAQTSPARGPGRPRKNSLDDKAAKTSPVKGRGRRLEDGMSARVPSTSPKRPVGRPRKASNTSAVLLISPKKPVGRPRKGSTASAVVGSASPKRPVGRPRKEATATISSPQKLRKDKTRLPPKSASQPTTQDEWTRIDEISDSDSPATPSPRRRRASSSPAFIRPLDFERPRSPSVKPKATASGAPAIKPTDAGWPAIQVKIFPKIAETITESPISEDLAAPSWHEKILLYDPIVLEDLTAWLNKQGLRTEYERIKPKIKTKGRKKKDAPPEVDEWETIRDELKPWMVQKWCEDNSICCLWKEGLRGGVKARY